MAAVGRFSPLFPGFRVCQQKLYQAAKLRLGIEVALGLRRTCDATCSLRDTYDETTLSLNCIQIAFELPVLPPKCPQK